MKTDSEMAAKRAGLVISDRTVKGITREIVVVPPKDEDEKDTFYWNYFLPTGKQITNDARIIFFNSLAVPPAWIDVWFSTDELGHIQATGKDAKGRTQYRYHPIWNETKSDIKYSNIDDFAKFGLTTLRLRVQSDIELEKMPREKAVALVIRLMDEYHIRVGSDQYARENDSYGLTTIQEGHLEILEGKTAIEGKIDAIFDFIGKSGKRWRLLIEDDMLASLIKESGEIGGNDDNQDLFRYLDGNGNDFDIKAEHINAYISKWAGSDYTAKDFRTWAASYKTAARLALISEATESELNQIIQLFDDAEKEVEGTEDQPIIKWKGINLKRADGLVKLAKNKKVPGSNKKERLNSMLAVIDTVAGDLGNTRAVCRSSYIRPMIMNDWEDKEFMKRWNSVKGKKKIPNLNKEESIVVNYMRKYE